MTTTERPVPVTYKAKIAGLQRKIARLEAELRERGAAITRVRQGKRRHPSIESKCEDCGAGPGVRCVTPSEIVMSKPHHMRGRTSPCGNTACRVCAANFRGAG